MREEQIKPPITYFGNKANLARWICSYFPTHHTYVEPFGGSASVLLAKKPAKVEVYNDINKELVNLFRVLRSKEDFQRLREALDLTLHSREEFNLARHLNTDDPVEMARRTMIRFRQSHGGHTKQWSYCVDASAVGMSASVRKWMVGIERLPDLHKRMQKVQIESLDWREVIKKYDTPNTLFYLDPPYIQETRLNGKYQHEIGNEDHIELVKVLMSMEGKVILSGYKHPIYAPLLDCRWKLIKKEVVANSSSQRDSRTECLWISPTAKKQKNTGILKANIDQNDLPTERMRQGSLYSSMLKADNMTKLITEEIEKFRRMNRKITKTAIAHSLNISREHVSKRYSDLFRELRV